MKYISTSLITVLTLIFVSSCNSNKQEPETFLNFKNNTIEDKFGACDGNGACGEIEIKYPFFSDNNKIVDNKINSEITKSITSFYNVKTIEETPKKFISDFTDFTKEFPEAANNKWKVSMKYKVESNTEKNLSLSFYMEGYTGGAHGFRTLTYSNYNTTTGAKLKLKDLISDINKLRLVARDTFIEKYDLNPSESLNKQGFWFVDDIFSLNNNFIISSEGISFHYNQYEIAPYALGTFDIDIPRDKLEGLLN